MQLYHSEVFMPQNLVNQSLIMMKRARVARFSAHVIDWIRGFNSESTLRQYKHRYTETALRNALENISLNRPNPFEVGVENGYVVKYAVRVSLDADNDISVIIGANGVVRTAWINSKEDTHKTLNTEKYCKKI